MGRSNEGRDPKRMSRVKVGFYKRKKRCYRQWGRVVRFKLPAFSRTKMRQLMTSRQIIVNRPPIFTTDPNCS